MELIETSDRRAMGIRLAYRAGMSRSFIKQQAEEVRNRLAEFIQHDPTDEQSGLDNEEMGRASRGPRSDDGGGRERSPASQSPENA